MCIHLTAGLACDYSNTTPARRVANRTLFRFNGLRWVLEELEFEMRPIQIGCASADIAGWRVAIQRAFERFLCET
jgi:hypothetical protein